MTNFKSGKSKKSRRERIWVRLIWWFVLNVLAAFLPLFFLLVIAYFKKVPAVEVLLESSDIMIFVTVVCGATVADIIRLEVEEVKDLYRTLLIVVTGLGAFIGALMVGALAVPTVDVLAQIAEVTSPSAQATNAPLPNQTTTTLSSVKPKAAPLNQPMSTPSSNKVEVAKNEHDFDRGRVLPVEEFFAWLFFTVCLLSQIMIAHIEEQPEEHLHGTDSNDKGKSALSATTTGNDTISVAQNPETASKEGVD